MKSKQFSLSKWMFMLSGILLIALSSCTKDDLDFEASDQPTLNPNDAIPSFHQEVDDEYKEYLKQ